MTSAWTVLLSEEPSKQESIIGALTRISVGEDRTCQGSRWDPKCPRRAVLMKQSHVEKGEGHEVLAFFLVKPETVREEKSMGENANYRLNKSNRFQAFNANRTCTSLG